MAATIASFPGDVNRVRYLSRGAPKTCPRSPPERTVDHMSYVHCPACKRAYHVARHGSCPSCPVPATPVDPTEDIVAATDALARALARASPDQRAAALARIAPRVQQLEAPRRVAALAPSLTSVALALIARLAPRRVIRAMRAIAA
jgi:hypothetical protein